MNARIVALSMTMLLAGGCGSPPSAEAPSTRAPSGSAAIGSSTQRQTASDPCNAIRSASARNDLSGLRLPSYTRCVVGRSGAAYGVRVDGVVAFPTPNRRDQQSHLVNLSLVHVAADGATATFPLTELNEATADHPAGTLIPDGDETQVLSEFRVVDVDDDGEPEIWFDFYRKTEGAGAKTYFLLQFANGGFRPFPLPKQSNTRVPPLYDVDGDGKPEIIRSGPYERARPTDCFGGGPDSLFAGGPYALWYAKGEWRSDVERDRGMVAKRCARVPNEALAQAKFGDALFEPIFCARARGMSPVEVLAAIRSTCAGFYTHEQACGEDRRAPRPPPPSCRAEIRDLIDIEPEVKIR